MRTVLLALALALPGCATIVASKFQTVSVNTEPPGLVVKVDGQDYTTPADVTLSTEKPHVVTWPDGSTSDIKQTGNAWMLGNILLLPPFGTLIGLAVDGVSGAVKRGLSPRKVTWKKGVGVLPPKPKDPDNPDIV